jgi:hypothetical protein
MSLKKYFPDIRMGGNKVDPDEINARVQYCVFRPGVGTAAVGTIAAGTVNAAWTVVNKVMDYPRTLLFTVVGPSGGVGGTCKLNGTDQFGVTQTESIVIGSANAGGTKAGTKIFDTVTSGTYYPNGVDNTSTATLGFAIGTGSGLLAKFGLPVRIGAVADVKRISFDKNGTYTAVNGGTIDSSLVFTATHSFMGTQIVAATDTYHVDILPTYNGEATNNLK